MTSNHRHSINKANTGYAFAGDVDKTITDIQEDVAELLLNGIAVNQTITGILARLAALEGVQEPPPAGNPEFVDLPGFKLIFSDDFDEPITSTRYGAYPSPWGDTRYKQGDTTNGGIYTGLSKCSVANSILTIALGRDGDTGQPRSVAILPRIAGTDDDQLYGRYAIRFRSPVRGTGWKTAWLLWPQDDQWPKNGEIDFPEGNLTSTISAFMHRQNATSGSDQDVFNTSARYDQWHTAVIEWTPTRCEFFLDGASIGKATSRIPNTPMHWVIQSETALDGSIPAATATIEVDWLAVWAYQP